MKYIPADTTLEAARVQFAVFRRKGLDGRSQMMADMCQDMRENAEAGIRFRHPEYDEKQVRRELIRRMLGPELFKRVFEDRGR